MATTLLLFILIDRICSSASVIRAEIETEPTVSLSGSVQSAHWNSTHHDETDHYIVADTSISDPIFLARADHSNTFANHTVDVSTLMHPQQMIADLVYQYLRSMLSS